MAQLDKKASRTLEFTSEDLVEFLPMVKEKYGKEVNISTIENAEPEHQQSLGRLFLKLDCLQKLRSCLTDGILNTMTKIGEIKEEEPHFDTEKVIESVENKCIENLHTKLELEKVVNSKKRLLLLIAEKEQIIENLKKLIPKMDNTSRISKKDLEKIVKESKLYAKRHLKGTKRITSNDKSTVESIEAEIFEENGLYQKYQSSQEDLEVYKEKCSQYRGLPPQVKLAQIKVAQAQECLIKKQEDLERILGS
ncbi:unnamed protein product [Moneuplotes crassus]|uniref:Uncharacterized protein n=1 Tax=Euplotes crassus TaxID=5936 RepID=A0AAD2D4B3_EUPCR|nr:unnamed protein product [Moneuplotes crassus]